MASPRARPSSTWLIIQAASALAASTAAITAQAAQPTNAVLPSMNDCMACMMSGVSSKISDVVAPSTTPTTTPASSRRSVCCTPLASSKVSSTAATAPMKAAPVSPMRANALVASGDTPNSIIASATPSDAPEALPSK